ncbi:TetR/AcrR family transcriptional regulator [Gordonia phthalatica]|uniref:TetR family transcriptional regulator n=1 Tax=Gordonia phthalatica TaxID=1136941 RepID=A0A0N9N9W4_9ACTN|nr:TetR/AcrR family transcriptional regulator [Gordonia phthalatica]ALG85081.1 TetR family transcriptional regulator [Gordonia phthalatica]
MGHAEAVAPAQEPTVRPRAKHLGPERRRPQILDVALEIAAESGVSAVTIVAIAERMNVTRPVVYAGFPGRAEILQALIAREERYLGEALAVILRDRDVAAPESVFVEGFQSLLSAVQARPQGWRLLYGSPDADVMDLFGRGRRVVVERCSQLLAPTLASWGVDDAAAKLPVLVEFWVSAGESAVRTLLAQDPDTHVWSPDRLGAFVGQAVYRGLRHA